MERHTQADNAFLEWMETMSKNVVHIADAWYAAVKWADQHPQWIPVEEELPKKDGKYLFYDEVLGHEVSIYYDGVTLVPSITHWMSLPQPPRKEE